MKNAPHTAELKELTRQGNGRLLGSEICLAILRLIAKSENQGEQSFSMGLMAQTFVENVGEGDLVVTDGLTYVRTYTYPAFGDIFESMSTYTMGTVFPPRGVPGSVLLTITHGGGGSVFL